MNSFAKTLISLSVTAVVSVGLLWGGDLLTRRWIARQDSEQVRETFGEFWDTAHFESVNTSEVAHVTGAWKALDDEDLPLVSDEAQRGGHRAVWQFVLREHGASLLVGYLLMVST